MLKEEFIVIDTDCMEFERKSHFSFVTDAHSMVCLPSHIITGFGCYSLSRSSILDFKAQDDIIFGLEARMMLSLANNS